ncbi:hypothetical protein cyc_02796 [Cyclospora cayetanensis]|uniref:Uncharacterized protein n=1 Tax=Cyclospora cayetanensis TaxID=88456 RepID=A0A1D3DAV4_9EIME|nr:hypothetical protein cyc_02796 [Cyclospora cayetanensis]
MGNLLDSACLEEGGLCICLRQQPEEGSIDVTREEAGGTPYQRHTEAAKAAARPHRLSSSKGTTASKAKSERTPKRSPPTAAPPAASNMETTRALDSQAAAATEPSISAQRAEADASAAPTLPAAAPEANESPSEAKDEAKWVAGSLSPPLDKELLQQILDHPHRVHTLLLQSIFKKWDPQGTGLSLDGLSVAVEFLCSWTECRNEREVEDRLFYSLSDGSTLTCSNFISLVEDCQRNQEAVAEVFMGLQPQEGPERELTAELPDARAGAPHRVLCCELMFSATFVVAAALRQMCETNFGGAWLGEEAIEFLLDGLISNAEYQLPLRHFVNFAETLGIVVRSINLLYIYKG